MGIATQPIVRTLELTQNQSDVLEEVLRKVNGTIYIEITERQALDVIRDNGDIEVCVKDHLELVASDEMALSDILHELTKPVIRAVG